MRLWRDEIVVCEAILTMRKWFTGRIWAWLLALLAAACLASCVGIEADPESDLPGNAPADWEGKTLGVPL